MERLRLPNNYIFALGKIFLFLIIFCFIWKVTGEFLDELKSQKEVKIFVFYLSILLPFLFYTFISDLNSLYHKIQKFFFRAETFSLLFPSLLILSGIGFLILPKLFNLSLNKDMFVFVGGIFFTIHLIFSARSLKSNSFIGIANYLFNFSLIYLITLLLLMGYLRIGVNFSLKDTVSSGFKKGVTLLKQISTQIFSQKEKM